MKKRNHVLQVSKVRPFGKTLIAILFDACQVPSVLLEMKGIFQTNQ